MRMTAAGVLVAMGVAFGQAWACDEHRHVQRPRLTVAKSEASWLTSAASGAWFTPARNGEGVLLQALPGGDFLAVWFTFPAVAEAGQQAWLISEPARPVAGVVEFRMRRPQGARFGADFDPAQVQQPVWGTLRLQRIDCNTLEMQYSGPPGYGTDSRLLTRLTSHAETGCDGPERILATGARSLEGLRSKGGAWFVPSRSGEGWLIEELPDARTLVVWFTYTPDGRQAWMLGVGDQSDGGVEIDLRRPVGTRFGSAFDAAQIEQVPWGRLRFAALNCSSATLSYAAAQPGWGAATRMLSRLNRIAGAPCVEGIPAAPSGLAWTEGARLPGPAQSELAAATLDGKLYALGGFGDPRGFKRYDPADNTWATLAPLPAGRDHAAAFGADGGIFLVGGAPNGAGDSFTAAWRYDVATGEWAARPELPFVFGSHAVVLDGLAYIGDESGALLQYDPRSRQLRRIAAFGSRPRDHSQVLAFQDEIWMLGGRSPEHGEVAIYNPAADRWRAGPRLQVPRGGFAAASTGQHLLIGGGEAISGPWVLVPAVETYTVGEEGWRVQAGLQLPVHGAPGVSLDDRVYAISGGSRAGFGTPATGRLWSLTLP